MFAATTTDALTLSDISVLKRTVSSSSIPSCLDLTETPTASSWSPDNAFLYISSAHAIHRYEPTSNVLKEIYRESGVISHLVSTDNNSVIFASGDKIHVLECDPNIQISQTFESQKAAINSLSLSNDNALLVSSCPGAVHVHNLALRSHTVLKGLPNHDINTSTFHPHSRNRLLVAAGKQLLVYDLTRPSCPVKTIFLDDSVASDIAGVACSPFSKTLAAIATSTGFVGLIDLEKEKSLFRSLNLRMPLTTLGFSPEGAAIYLGTETGKVLLVDLRALDKPPKTIILSNSGNRIQTISVQKKTKTDGAVKTPANALPMGTRKPSASSEVIPAARRTTTTTVTSRSASKGAPSPARSRATKVEVAASPGITRQVSSTTKESGFVGTPLKKSLGKETKKVLSPVRDPLGNSGGTGDIANLDELANRRRGKATTTPVKLARKPSADSHRLRPTLSPAGSTGKISTRSTEVDKPRRTRTLPTTTSTSAVTTRKASTGSITTSASTGGRLAVARTSPQPVRRERTLSSASRAGSEAISAVSSRKSSKVTNENAISSATSTSASPTFPPSRPSSSASRPGSSLTSGTTRSSPGRSSSKPISRANLSRTPSPDLSDVQHEPVTPVPAQKQKAMGVLGLGTPEVDGWIQAGKEKERKKRGKDIKGKVKTVGFQDEEEDDKDVDENEDDEEVRERKRILSMQISPRRPIPGVSASGSGSTTDSWLSSSSKLSPNSNSGVSPGVGGGAQELLKTIVQDVMYDFQRETKAEMMGLHLDLLRMGRGWKAELRTLMDEYVGDLRDLREENQRLRLENERLRRGY